MDHKLQRISFRQMGRKLGPVRIKKLLTFEKYFNINTFSRSPKYTRSTKHIKNEKDENLVNEERESLRPKFCRHLILIRHGQYNLQGVTDNERILTKLGNLYNFIRISSHIQLF